MHTKVDHKEHKSQVKIGLGIAATLLICAISLGLTGSSPLNSSAQALGANTTDFVTTWETTTANEAITIPIDTDYTYNYNVDWGDGSTSNNLTVVASHTYAVAGSYQVRINGTFPAIRLDNSSATNQQELISIDQWGNNPWQSMYYAFSGAANLTYTATDQPNLSQVTDMSGMFFEDNQFNGAIGNWNTSNVTNMSAMFYDANQFNQDLSAWNTANVTDMSFMFAGYDNPTIFNQDLSTWNTSNVTTMAAMFQYDSDFNQDSSTWNVGKVTDMSYMFTDASNFNGDIGNWNVSQVADMSYMFYDATSFNQNLNKWDTAQVTDMSRMFSGSNAMIFNGDISTWNTGKVTDMSNMFASDATSSFNRDISNWNVGNVTNMRGMFYHDPQFNQNLNLWNTSSVTNMAWMFSMATSFNGDISTWNTSKVTDMSYMLVGASSFNQNIDNWGVGNVIDMNHMFNGAIAFNKSLDNWNVSKVANMQSMFQSATAFNQDLNNWKTTSLTNTRSLFDGATNFNGNISNWDVSHVTEMWATFKYATSFNQNISDWDTSSATDMKWVFLGASSFNRDLSNWDISQASDLTYFLYGTGLSQSNYEATLIGWSKENVEPNVPLYANGQTYCSQAAQNARNILTGAPNNWAITGDALNCTVAGNQAPVVLDKDLIIIKNKASTNNFPASDPDGNNLYFDITAQPAHGSLVVNVNGSYTYTPDSNFIGRDSFSFKARDQQADSGLATVTLNVVNPTVIKVGNRVLTDNMKLGNRLAFSGSAPAGATITITVHSDPVTCSTTADSSGRWSCQLPKNLTPGEHSVKVVVSISGLPDQTFGPYEVSIEDSSISGQIKAPDTGYGVTHQNWQLKLAAVIAISVTLIALGTLGLKRKASLSSTHRTN